MQIKVLTETPERTIAGRFRSCRRSKSRLSKISPPRDLPASARRVARGGGRLLKGWEQPTLEVLIVESPGFLARQIDEATGLPLITSKVAFANETIGKRIWAIAEG